MAGQILVALKKNDEIEEIIPYVEKIAKPGMKVVFLTRYPIEPAPWLRDHWVITESRREAILAAEKIREAYSWDMQRELAEQKIFAACRTLCKLGVEITVDVYAGSLREAVETYTCNGPVQFVIMQAGNGLIRRFLNRTIPVFGRFKRPSFSPVVMLQPGTLH